MQIYVVNSDNGLIEAYLDREKAIAAAVKYIKEDLCYEEIHNMEEEIHNIEDDISREIDRGFHCYEFWVEPIELQDNATTTF